MTRILHRPTALATLLAIVFVALNLVRADPESARLDDTGVPYVTLYAEPQSAPEVLANQGDGQAFAALAQDPTLSRPEVFLAGSAEAAYRAQRPLLAWLVWVTSAGQAGAVPFLLFGWAVVGTALLVLGIQLLAADRGRSTALAAVALALPGALVDLDWSGPEALATGLALIGVWRWQRSDVAGAIALLTAATLGRETVVLVVVGLALWSLWRHGLDRRVLLLSIPPGVLAAWWVVVRLRLGAWPTDAGNGRLGVPLRGLVEGAAEWGPADVVYLGLLVVLVVLAVRAVRGRAVGDDLLSMVLVAQLPLAVAMGSDVWKRWEDFGRPLLPLYAVALVLALPRTETEQTFPTSREGRR